MVTYLRQAAILFGFTFLGEVLHRLLPFPIPAAIYGLVLLFIALTLGLVKVSQIRQVSSFLIAIMPVLFVAPTVNLLEYWPLLASKLLPFALILLVSTVVVFAVSGVISKALLKKKEKVVQS